MVTTILPSRVVEPAAHLMDDSIRTFSVNSHLLKDGMLHKVSALRGAQCTWSEYMADWGRGVLLTSRDSLSGSLPRSSGVVSVE